VKKHGIWTYENRLMVILSITMGCVMLDRLSVAFLSPFLVKDFHLTNTELGLLSSVLAGAWSFSCYVVSAYSDASARRKSILLAAVVLFSVFSGVSALAFSYVALLVCRGLIGFSEGPVMPLAQSLMAADSSKERRGFNMGVIASLGTNLLGALLGPLILTRVAAAWGWRSAFLFAGIPGLVMAVLIARYVIERPMNKELTLRPVHLGWTGALQLLSPRNIRLCVLIGFCVSAYITVHMTFLPLYLVTVRGLSVQKASVFIAILGLAGCTMGILVPTASDFIGRKLTLGLACVAGLALPLGVMYLPTSSPLFPVVMFLGWMPIGTVPLFLSTIPAETVAAERLAGTMGLIMGLVEIIGGICAPIVAGQLGDRLGQSSPLWLAAGVSFLAALLSPWLIETAPGIEARREARRKAYLSRRGA
jgi:MFS transporter, ACS family, hexuronate transporter